MPCDSIIVVSVELGLNTDSGLLMQALKRLKANPERQADGSIKFSLDTATGVYRSGRLDINLGRWGTKDALINKIKASYSYEVVMSSIRRVGGTAQADLPQESGRQVVHVRIARPQS